MHQISEKRNGEFYLVLVLTHYEEIKYFLDQFWGYPFVDDITNGFGTVMLKDIYVNAKRRSPYRDKVIGSLDSLAILASGEWVCDCKAGAAEGYLNDYHGYSHHPNSAPPKPGMKRRLPQRGKTYRLIICSMHASVRA